MFVIYLHIKFYLASSNDSLIIIVKPKAEYEFQVAAISLFYKLRILLKISDHK